MVAILEAGYHKVSLTGYHISPVTFNVIIEVFGFKYMIVLFVFYFHHGFLVLLPLFLHSLELIEYFLLFHSNPFIGFLATVLCCVILVAHSPW